MFREKNKANSNILTIIVQPETLALSGPQTMRLIPRDTLYDTSPTILHMKRFVEITRKFLHQHNLCRPETVIILENNTLHETVAKINFKPPRTLENLMWIGYPLSHKKNASFFFSALARENIFQYKLFAHLCDIQLIALTTCTMAKLHLYNKALDIINVNQLKNEVENINLVNNSLAIVKSYSTFSKHFARQTF